MWNTDWMVILWLAKLPNYKTTRIQQCTSLHRSTLAHRPSSLSQRPSEFPPFRHLRQRAPLLAAAVGRETAAGREPVSLRSYEGGPSR